MSIDVMILPGRKVALQPRALFARLGSVKGEAAAALLGVSPGLVKLGARDALAGDAVLEPGATYALRLASDNALLLSVALPGDFDEAAYVEDYGRGLSASEREAIVEGWRGAGAGLALSSGGGRAAGELEVMGALAVGFARAVSGWICVESGGFSEPAPGIYSAEALDGVEYRLASG